jgi:hypothetical protein
MTVAMVLFGLVDTGKIQLVNSFVAAGTLAMAITTIVSIWISQEQHKETQSKIKEQNDLMNKQLEEMKEQRKPILRILDNTKFSGNPKLIVKNIGFGPAENLEIILEDDATRKWEIPALGKDESEEFGCEPEEMRLPDSGKFVLNLKAKNLDKTKWSAEYLFISTTSKENRNRSHSLGFSVKKL